MEKFWPDIHEIEKTDYVIPFLEDTIESLKETYKGRINAQITGVEVLSDTMRSLKSSFDDMNRISIDSNSINKETSKNLQSKTNKKPVDVNAKSYDYELFNDHLYYRLFTITMTEVFPIEIYVCAGILKKDEAVFKIKNMNELRTTFLRITRSEKVKIVIMKMMKS